MASPYSDWFHDDITWCVHDDCPAINCYRNPANMRQRIGFHSYSDFKAAGECSYGECLEGCLHAHECFNKHDDPNDAMDELTAEYCDKCMFSSMEED